MKRAWPVFAYCGHILGHLRPPSYNDGGTTLPGGVALRSRWKLLGALARERKKWCAI